MKFSSVFLLITLFLTSTAWADKVFVEKLKSKSLSESQAGAIEDLIKSTVEERGHEVVTSKSGSDMQLKARVIKLGESIIISVSRYEDGEKENTAKLKAIDFDDVDTVVQRVVRAALNNQNAKKNQQMDQITREEMNSTNRRIQAVSQWRFGIGPTSFNNLNDDEIAVGFFFGRQFGINPNWAVNLIFDMAFGQGESNASITNLQVGTDYYLTRDSISPYLSVNMGYSGTALNDRDQDNSAINIVGETKSGFSGSVGAGVKLFRVSTVNLGFQADYNYLFADNRLGNPSWTSFKVLLYWGGY